MTFPTRPYFAAMAESASLLLRSWISVLHTLEPPSGPEPELSGVGGVKPWSLANLGVRMWRSLPPLSDLERPEMNDESHQMNDESSGLLAS
jgi:hypothetical protein